MAATVWACATSSGRAPFSPVASTFGSAPCRMAIRLMPFEKSCWFCRRNVWPTSSMRSGESTSRLWSGAKNASDMGSPSSSG